MNRRYPHVRDVRFEAHFLPSITGAGVVVGPRRTVAAILAPETRSGDRGRGAWHESGPRRNGPRLGELTPHNGRKCSILMWYCSFSR